MKKNILTKTAFSLIIFLSLISVNNVLASSGSVCPDLPYLMTDYIEEHKILLEKYCMQKGYLDEKCSEIANKAYEKFMNCFEDCGGYGDKGCESLSMSGDCSYYECTTNIDNNCAKKCKDYLLFSYNSSDKNSDKNNNYGGKTSNDNFDESLVGLPIDQSNVASPCIGETPKGSKLCPGDDKDILEYTKKQLVDSCSIPKGSDPKCEYICKTDLLSNGSCKEEGFFNWLGGLF
jgi:hypothetical protein